MTQKIEGKFYPLTPEVAQKLRAAKLTAAEWRLWSYLIEIDPFGEHYKDLPDTLTILKEVGISKPTFYRAIAKFQRLGIFDFQDKGFSFRNLTGVSKMRQQSQKRDNSLKNETTVSKMRQQSQKRENQSLKPLPGKDSSSSKISQTYSDFIQTLSDSKKEKFLSFALKKAAQLPKPPALPQKWIERNFKELYSQFCKEFGEAIAPTQDWENHPRRDEWLWEMQTLGAGAFVGLAPERERSERFKFREWAQANNRLKGG